MKLNARWCGAITMWLAVAACAAAAPQETPSALRFDVSNRAALESAAEAVPIELHGDAGLLPPKTTLRWELTRLYPALQKSPEFTSTHDFEEMYCDGKKFVVKGDGYEQVLQVRKPSTRLALGFYRIDMKLDAEQLKVARDELDLLSNVSPCQATVRIGSTSALLATALNEVRALAADAEDWEALHAKSCALADRLWEWSGTPRPAPDPAAQRTMGRAVVTKPDPAFAAIKSEVVELLGSIVQCRDRAGFGGRNSVLMNAHRVGSDAWNGYKDDYENLWAALLQAPRALDAGERGCSARPQVLACQYGRQMAVHSAFVLDDYLQRLQGAVDAEPAKAGWLQSMPLGAMAEVQAQLAAVSAWYEQRYSPERLKQLLEQAKHGSESGSANIHRFVQEEMNPETGLGATLQALVSTHRELLDQWSRVASPEESVPSRQEATRRLEALRALAANLLRVLNVDPATPYVSTAPK